MNSKNFSFITTLDPRHNIRKNHPISYENARNFIHTLWQYKPPKLLKSNLQDHTCTANNVFRDFIQGFTSFKSSIIDEKFSDEIHHLLRYLCLSPLKYDLEIGSLLPQPNLERADSLNDAFDPRHGLLARMRFTESHFMTFLTALEKATDTVKHYFSLRNYRFLIGNETGVETFAQIYKKATPLGVKITPVLFVSACPIYSKKNKNRTPQEDATVTQALSALIRKQTSTVADLYISGYQGVYPNDKTPSEVFIENTLMFIDTIDFSTIRLGDTLGSITPAKHQQFLQTLRSKKIPLKNVACHFHYNPNETIDVSLERVSALILISIFSGVTAIDCSSLAGGDQNPLSGEPSSIGNLSGNVLMSHLLGLGAAFKLNLMGLKTEEDYTEALTYIIESQLQTYRSCKDYALRLTHKHLQNASKLIS